MPRGLDRAQQRDPVLRAIASQLRQVAKSGQRVMAAVSGGADSLALAVGLSEIAPRLRLSVCVGTVDHGLRAESRGEVERVRAFCEARGLPFASERVHVEREGGLEAAARRARYAALERLADALGADWITTAHTASDQAETVLLRLGRGASARGARGVLPVRGRIARPLLGVTRAEVERFLAARKLAPLVVDPSNEDLSRARNRVRHRVLPELREALGPGVDAALARFAEAARDDEAALAAWAHGEPATRASLKKLPRAVLARWLRTRIEACGFRPNASELASAVAAVRAGKCVELGRRVAVKADRREVRVEPSGTTTAGAAVELGPGETPVAWAGVVASLERGPAKALDRWTLALPDDMALPLRMRPVQPGDRLPGERGTVRVKRLLIDAKVPRGDRGRVPVITDANGAILWVAGLRVAAPLHATRGARPGWLLRLRPLERTRASRVGRG